MVLPNSRIHIFQEADSNTCGPSCLAMIYAMRGKSVLLADVLRDFKQETKGATTYVPQLATHMATHGLTTNLMVSGSRIVSYAWKDLTSSTLIDELGMWLKLHPDDFYHTNNAFLLEYLREQGRVTISSYNATTWKSMLDSGSALLLCVDEAWLWGHRLNRTPQKIEFDDINGQVEGHFVVVTGYNNDVFHVLDPFPTRLKQKHGIYDIDENQLLNASLSWAPQFIEIKG